MLKKFHIFYFLLYNDSGGVDMENQIKILNLLNQKRQYVTLLNELVYGAIEIREKDSKKYIYLHTKEDGLQSTKYVGEYTEELYNLVLNNNIKVMLVGGGPELENLQKLTKELKLDSFVIFTDKVDYSVVPAYFNTFDVVVSFSTTETQGLTIIEGLAASKPTICINDESFTAMIEPNYNGYLFKNNDEFKDYIFKLMNDDKLYKEMSINARNSIYKYSKEVFASDILKVYHKAIKGHNKTSED